MITDMPLFRDLHRAKRSNAGKRVRKAMLHSCSFGVLDLGCCDERF